MASAGAVGTDGVSLVGDIAFPGGGGMRRYDSRARRSWPFATAGRRRAGVERAAPGARRGASAPRCGWPAAYCVVNDQVRLMATPSTSPLNDTSYVVAAASTAIGMIAAAEAGVSLSASWVSRRTARSLAAPCWRTLKLCTVSVPVMLACTLIG